MNRTEAKELLPVIEAFANGDDVQYLRLSRKNAPQATFSSIVRVEFVEEKSA